MMRLCANLMATRRISWTDHRISDDEKWPASCAVFFGCRAVRAMPDGGHHGEGRHHQRDVAVPAVPGSGLVVIQSKLVFGDLEAVLDRPTVPLDRDQPLDAGSGRAPDREEGHVAIAYVAADQQTAGPQTGTGVVVFSGVQISQFAIGPIMQPGTLGAVTGRQALPARRLDRARNFYRRAGNRRLRLPGPEMAIGIHPEHIALCGAAQRQLNIATP